MFLKKIHLVDKTNFHIMKLVCILSMAKEIWKIIKKPDNFIDLGS